MPIIQARPTTSRLPGRLYHCQTPLLQMSSSFRASHEVNDIHTAYAAYRFARGHSRIRYSISSRFSRTHVGKHVCTWPHHHSLHFSWSYILTLTLCRSSRPSSTSATSRNQSSVIHPRARSTSTKVSRVNACASFVKKITTGPLTVVLGRHE